MTTGFSQKKKEISRSTTHVRWRHNLIWPPVAPFPVCVRFVPTVNPIVIFLPAVSGGQKKRRREQVEREYRERFLAGECSLLIQSNAHSSA